MSICPEPEEHNRDTSDYLTLDNIYKYASIEELEAIVHSIYNRIVEELEIPDYVLTDKQLHKLAKGLRKPQWKNHINS